MKLKTWTIYKTENIYDMDNKMIKEGEMYFLLLRPDINKPEIVLGFSISKETPMSSIIDLQNKALSEKDIITILQENIGFTYTDKMTDLVINDNNLSATPVRDENIQTIIKHYNAFVKAIPTEFDTTDESIKGKDVFTELKIDELDMGQLLKTLQSGLAEYQVKIKEIQGQNLSEQELINKTFKLSTLQSNLILFFDQTVRRMDKIITEQRKEIEELKKQK